MVNRTQALVLGFFLIVLTSFVVILAAAPEVYDQALRLLPSWPRWVALNFLAAQQAGLLTHGGNRRVPGLRREGFTHAPSRRARAAPHLRPGWAMTPR